MGAYRSRELAHFGVDYVKCQISTYEKLHKKLRLSANSRLSFYDDFTIIEILPEMMTEEYERFYQIRDKATNVSLAFIGLGGIKKWMITRSDFLEVTGTGLILRGGYQYFVDFARALDIKIWKYIRVDICMDVKVNTQYFLETIIKDYGVDKTRVPWYTKGIMHALYFGEKMLSKNTYQFIRIYNKKLDSINKWKEWLYEKYAGVTDVTRLEVEIRRDKACFLTTEKLLSTDYLFGVCVRTFYPMNNQFFSFLHLEDFKRTEEEDGIWKKRLRNRAERKELQDLYGCSFKNPTEKKKWIATFVAYSKKLLVNGMSLSEIKEIIDINLSDEIDVQGVKQPIKRQIKDILAI